MASLRGGIKDPTDPPTPLGQVSLEPERRGCHPRGQAVSLTVGPHPGGKEPPRRP
jgi:hypothetical protein